MAAWAKQSDSYLQQFNPWAVQKTLDKKRSEAMKLSQPQKLEGQDSLKAMCSTHQKMRSMDVLLEDGMGGYCCHERTACKASDNPNNWKWQPVTAWDPSKQTSIFETADAWAAPPSFKTKSYGGVGGGEGGKGGDRPPPGQRGPENMPKHICSHHGKTRSESCLEPDGMGGWKCFGKHVCMKLGDGIKKKVWEDGRWRNGGLRSFNADLKVWVGGFPPMDPDTELNKSLKEHMSAPGRCIFAEIFASGTGGAAYATTDEASQALLMMHGSAFEYGGRIYTLQMGLYPIKDQKRNPTNIPRAMPY